MTSRPRMSALLAAGLLTTAGAARGLDVQPGFGSGDWVQRREAIELRLDGEPGSVDGRLAVLLDRVDVTELFRRTGETLVYRPELMPLPPGEHELVVYLVGANGEGGDDWRELARLPLKVLEPGGFQERRFEPRLDLETSALVDDRDGAGETGFEDLSGQVSLQGGLVRPGGALQAQVDLVGVTDRQSALRFGTEGEGAPKLDLASYRVELTRNRVRGALGHVSFGDSRHLVNRFTSRGLTFAAPLGSRFELGLGAMNGTSIVGWDNPVGLSDGDHRVLTGSLGFDVLADRPGSLRLTGSWLDARQLPRAGFNTDRLTDREESDGWSLGLSAQSPGGRLRLGLGWAAASFDNPEDPLLGQGAELVAVEEETRDARYLDLDWALVENRGQRLPTTVTLGYRHERVEPLYRSVAAPVQADVDRHAVDLSATLGPISAQLAWSDQHDNLDDVPSILTTDTERRGLNLFVPLGQLLAGDDGGAPPGWLPDLSYGFDRTHQAGRDVPVNGGFNAGHVPDQVSLSHSGGLQWRGLSWYGGYTLSFSDQDNRQPGRETADFQTLVHSWTGGWSPLSRLDLSLDLSRERSANRELDEVERTLRGGFGFDWRITDWTGLSGSISHTDAETDPDSRTFESTVVDLRWTVRLTYDYGERHGVAPQLFVRYAWQDTETEDRVFGLSDSLRDWSVNSGFSISLY